jgi:hypothetical protein
MTNPADARRSSYAGPPAIDPLNLTGSLQPAHRTGQGHPPPLLSSESTAGRSSGSSGSTSSSVYYTPGTPMEPSLDRALPIPILYPQKSTGSFDNPHQLLPLRPPLSPQTSMLGSQQSLNGTLPSRLCPLPLYKLVPLFACNLADNSELQASMRLSILARWPPWRVRLAEYAVDTAGR